MASAKSGPPEDARVLEEGGADLSPWGPNEEDPRVASTAKHAILLATGLSTEDAAGVLGVSEARVRQRVGHERTLLGVKTPTGWRLPALQFEGAGEVPGVGRVLREMDPGLHVLAGERANRVGRGQKGQEGEHGVDQAPRQQGRDALLLGGGEIHPEEDKGGAVDGEDRLEEEQHGRNGDERRRRDDANGFEGRESCY